MDEIVKAIFNELYNQPWICAIKVVRYSNGRTIEFSISETCSEHWQFSITLRGNADQITFCEKGEYKIQTFSLHDKDFLKKILQLCEGHTTS